jgi:hypothetical protein
LNNKILLGCGSVAALLALLACGIIFYLVGQFNFGKRLEVDLTVAWENQQNFLSSYVSGFQEQSGVMSFNATLISDTMVAAIAAQPGDENFGQDALVAAISQAYPDMGVAEMTTLAGNLMRYVEAQRSGFRDLQSQTLDRVRVYETYLETFPGVIIAPILGLPSNTLEARVNRQVIATGQAALDIIRQPISNTTTNDAFTTGTMDPLVPNATARPR